MTTVAVMADPPTAGAAGTGLVAADALSEAEAATLYEAMLGDVCEAVAGSGGELLVNYRPADQLPADVDDPEAAVRDVVQDALDDAGDVRYEVQVGSTFDARVGNTITHLLEREGVRTAAVVTPAAAFLGRQQIDAAAMKLRRNDAVLGPSPEGRVYYAGFADPIDFADAFAPPAVETLTRRARDADLDVDFLPMLPVVERPTDLATAVPQISAQRAAERRLPTRTAARLADLDLAVVGDDGTPNVRRR